MLALEGKCDKFCKEISMVPDALQLNNFHWNKKKGESALVSVGCSFANWFPFIGNEAIKALSKLKNTTGGGSITGKLQALSLFFWWYAGKNIFKIEYYSRAQSFMAAWCKWMELCVFSSTVRNGQFTVGAKVWCLILCLMILCDFMTKWC